MFRITFDPRKRDRAWRERGLRFEDAGVVFEGYTLDDLDDRFDYAEERWITIGAMGDRVVVLVWAPAGKSARRIISMRAANGYEQAEYWKRLAQG